jgi:hypothetical protein
MASGGVSSTNLEATAHSTDQQPDRMTLSKDLTSQVILEILEMILAGRSLHEVLTSVVRVLLRLSAKTKGCFVQSKTSL